MLYTPVLYFFRRPCRSPNVCHRIPHLRTKPKRPKPDHHRRTLLIHGSDAHRGRLEARVRQNKMARDKPAVRAARDEDARSVDAVRDGVERCAYVRDVLLADPPRKTL